MVDAADTLDQFLEESLSKYHPSLAFSYLGYSSAKIRMHKYTLVYWLNVSKLIINPILYRPN